MKTLKVLIAVAGFAAGFYLGRWMHRPIELRDGVVQLTAIVPSPDSLPAYDTLEEAAVHAAERLYQCSHVYECAGVIAQRPDGKYVLGPLRSDYEGDHVVVPYGVPHGWKMVGDFHSHPCNPDSHEVPYFSPDDIADDTMRKITGIMLDECTGDVHEFTPGRDSPNDTALTSDPTLFATKGRVIGHIVVDGKSVEPDTGY